MKYLSSEQIEQRAKLGKELFSKGFNCSQAVFAACADLYDIDEKTALLVSASFGGGIGRMRQTCGTACGMFLLAGLENGNTEPDKPNAKLENYKLVQHLAEQFKEENGDIICAKLLGLDGQPPKQKHPCSEMVANAIRIYLTEIQK